MAEARDSQAGKKFKINQPILEKTALPSGQARIPRREESLDHQESLDIG